MLKHLALILFAIAFLCALFSHGHASDKWAMYQGNPAHTGHVSISIDPEKFSVRWSNKISTAALDQVVAADGRAVASPVMNYEAFFYIIDSFTGNVLFNKDFGDIEMTSNPSYYNGNIYFQTYFNYDSYLRAYRITDGALIFRSSYGSYGYESLQPTIYKGKVYIGCGYNSYLYGFNGDNGREEWASTSANLYDKGTPAVDDKSVYIYTDEQYPGPPGLVVLDRSTGETAFRIADPGYHDILGFQEMAPVLGGSSDALAIQGNRLIRFDLDARSAAWAKTGLFSGQPTVANGVVYALDGGVLGAYSQSTGDLLWTWNGPGAEIFSLKDAMVATNGHLFVHSDSRTYCIDLATRTAVWSYPATGRLSLGEGALYIAGSDGTLTAISLGIPDLSAPESVDFGTVGPGRTASRAVPLRNVGDSPIEVTGIVSSQAAFTLDTPATPFTLAAHETVELTVTFSPPTSGTTTGSISITSDDPNEREISVSLTGKSLDLYTLTATAGDGGQISPSGEIPARNGDSATFSIDPDPYYMITDVLVDGVSTGRRSSYTFSDISADHTISATFAPETYYDIDASATTGGRIDPCGPISILSGESLTISITPDAGYRLASLFVDGAPVQGQDAYTFSDVHSDHAIVAVFARDLDYFGMQNGNHFEFTLSYSNGKTAKGTSDTSLDVATYPYPTFVSRESTESSRTSTWYQVSSTGLFMLQQGEGYEKVAFTPGIATIKNPLIPKTAWATNSDFSMYSLSGKAKLTAKASPPEMVSVPAGRFLAYPIAYTLKLSAKGKSASTSWKDWFSPYIGAVRTVYPKSNVKSVELASFAIGEGTVSTPPPVITQIIPSAAPRGSSIRIVGFQFGDSQGASSLRIGNVECGPVLSWSDTAIDCVVPDTATTGPASVVTDTWTSNDTVVLTVTAPPVITGVSPSQGKRGAAVQVHGYNFGTAKGVIHLGAVQAKVSQWTENLVAFTVPPKMAPGVYTVTATTQEGESALENAFTVAK